MSGLISRILSGLFVITIVACTQAPASDVDVVTKEPFHLSQAEPDYSLTESGTLVIVGGAMRDSLIFATFLDKAGGSDANIIIVPTAGGDSLTDENLERSRQWAHSRGAKNVTVIHTKDRELADSEDYVKPIQEATGVWFTGGRQWRIADSFLNTRTHEEFSNVLRRGGVIGGSSAGATIQGAYLARGDTKTNTIMMGDHEDGMNFFPNTAIDQHLLKRNRQFDLEEIISTYPELLGIGIDENTAIVVHGDTFEVIGAGYVAIYDAGLWSQDILPGSGKFFLLSRGDVYNFKQRKVAAWSSRGRMIESLTITE